PLPALPREFRGTATQRTTLMAFNFPFSLRKELYAELAGLGMTFAHIMGGGFGTAFKNHIGHEGGRTAAPDSGDLSPHIPEPSICRGKTAEIFVAWHL
ncbi:MAG: hypothetical protein P8M65_06550, partial [Roseibacillus sp.]|nr:hypothetical protein [Roseibacillus sp.]